MTDQKHIIPTEIKIEDSDFKRHSDRDIKANKVGNEYSDHINIPRIPPITTNKKNHEARIGTGEANLTTTACTRCKNEFNQFITKRLFKLCHHCRELQRERSRRWQMKTKEKEGVCRRCGSELPNFENDYVLCEHCRLNLRSSKAIRVQEGKCVHCSGPKDPKDYNHKVCSRCRANDKIRRANLERVGACNRCTNILSEVDQGHKACTACRNSKRKAFILPNSTNINMGINIDMDLDMNHLNHFNNFNSFNNFSNFNDMKNGDNHQHVPVNGLTDTSISVPHIHPGHKNEEIVNNNNSEFINSGELINDKINIKSTIKANTKAKSKTRKRRKLIKGSKVDLSIDSNEYNDNVYVNNVNNGGKEQVEILNEGNINNHQDYHIDHHHGVLPQIQHSQLNQQLNHHLQLSGVVDETSVDEEAVDRILREANIPGIGISDDDQMGKDYES
ncbi:unnamed protein product [[Candida] boidinii]|uniref:Unnamed protein product n=1 Tax=Candida boidinii TaxID=5477 RepID=A0A9W6WG01_CANBO|nr:hypothetical protein B5S30_g2199 [[Candida] boidinii]OWB83233.1 hypothetical protein B5S33_g1862 [[Candida] boidinii]GME69970.1 unnamed protein product [[Candida] boidinii]